MDKSVVLELMVRAFAAGAFAALAVAFARSPGARAPRIAGTLLCISVVGFAYNTPIAIPLDVGMPIVLLVRMLSQVTTGALWLLIVTLFEDRPITPPLLAPIALLAALGAIALASPEPWMPRIWTVHNIVEFALLVHALFVIYRSWRGDLVEQRRRLRGPFFLIVGAYAVFQNGLDQAEMLGLGQDWFGMAMGWSLVVIGLSTSAAFLQARAEFFGATKPVRAAAADGLDPQDRATLARLDEAMDGQQVWRREGLTIASLAEAVGAPEHRLRRLINDHLGARNFASFVNARRIEAAKAALTDPAQARTTIAAVAFDHGFASLGPFNRAFKEATGLTPTEFRRGLPPDDASNPEKAGRF